MNNLKDSKRTDQPYFNAQEKRRISRTIMGFALISLVSIAAISVIYFSPKATGQSVPSGVRPQAKRIIPLSETGLYIVRFNEPALASYMGGIPGLEATSPRTRGTHKLDPKAPESRRYVERMRAKHAEFKAQAEKTVGRKIDVVFEYTGVLNGLAIKADLEEAMRLRSLPGVAEVYPDEFRTLDTDVGPAHIKAPSIWAGTNFPAMPTRGEGIVIGMIDSGINSQHPSFTATDGDGYVHTNPFGAGVYKGWCATNPGFCNDKLIAARGLNPLNGNPEDDDGHGSHTASTAAGNIHTASFSVGSQIYNIPIQGVAPRANLVAYKVCSPNCPNSASIAAVNHAIMDDGVDVLNYSISGPDDPWNNAVDLAFLDAYNAGIFVAASAGNTGPGASTVAKTAPWNATVAASTINRVIAYELDVTGPTMPAALQNVPAVPGVGTNIMTAINAEIRFSQSNTLGCSAFPGGFFQGAVALIERGTCTFQTKMNNATAAGAIAVVVFNNLGGPAVTMTGLDGNPPAVMLSKDSGEVLRDLVIANSMRPGSEGATPTMININTSTAVVINDVQQDIVAGFSSRGPSQFDLLKPDFAAPGVNILAALRAIGGEAARYGFLQGTSMASPHAAGAGALMKSLYPTWSPAEIKSALASTATPDILLDHLTLKPAMLFDQGHGLLDLLKASNVGLVFDETGANYSAADPAIGGDPRTLNQPNFVDKTCAGACSWSRTVKNALPFAVNYEVNVDAPPGLNVNHSPTTFNIGPGESRMINISATSNGAPIGEFTYGSVSIEPLMNRSEGSSPGISSIHMPMAVKLCVANPFVTTTDDDGIGSLRRAVRNACPGSIITFLTDFFSGPITLTSGQIVIDKDLTIQGPGADIITIQTTAAPSTTSRVFRVTPSVKATISGVRITGGNTSGTANTADGGGIFNSGDLTVDNCVIAGNHGGGNGGGGIASWGPLTVTNSTISNNTSSFGGGAVLIINAALVNISSSTFSGNSATQGGGLTVFATAGSTNVTVSNTTISGNTASTSGGIANIANGLTANMTINSSTITNNMTTGGASGVLNSRISGNSNLFIANSIVANNTGGTGQMRNESTSVTTSNGYNLLSDASLTAAAGDQLNTNPILGPLANNGGPTQTHLPLQDSPAIDKGKNNLMLVNDQRGDGFVRTADDPMISNAAGGDGTDIGSIELQVEIAPTPTPTPTPSPSPSPISGVIVSGQVLTPDGRGLASATVVITDPAGVDRVLTTSTFGSYSFSDIPTGQNYVMRVSSKRFRFSARNLFVSENMFNVNFTGLE